MMGSRGLNASPVAVHFIHLSSVPFRWTSGKYVMYHFRTVTAKKKQNLSRSMFVKFERCGQDP